MPVPGLPGGPIQGGRVRNAILKGVGRHLVPIPQILWHRQIRKGAERLKASLEFMSNDHHRVRYFVVREIPRLASPIVPETISGELGLPLDRVNQILEDLERHLTFLFRNEQGAVVWAYPVTAESTPHHVEFSTGECIHAA